MTTKPQPDIDLDGLERLEKTARENPNTSISDQFFDRLVDAAPQLIAAARERDRLRGLLTRALPYVSPHKRIEARELADEIRQALETREGP